MNEENIIIWQKWIDPYGLDEPIDLNNVEQDLPDPEFFTEDTETYEEESDYEENNENFEILLVVEFLIFGLVIQILILQNKLQN